MNSTDKQKLAIRKMFEQPIEEVEEALDELLQTVDVLNPSNNYLRHKSLVLAKKINNLKALLPTVQGED
jgi:hypothetical protein